MKQIFRHLIGEYNGEILKALCYYHNEALNDLIDIFYYWATVQWLPPGKGTSEASEIRQEDAVGIAHAAGLFSPIVRATFMAGSVRFAGERDDGTDSSQSVQAFVSGAIRYITDAQLQDRDISTFAGGFTKAQDNQSFTGDDTATQVGMVPSDVEPVGYLVPAETVEGTGDTLHLEYSGAELVSARVKLVSTIPASGFYIPYYGPEYAWLDKALLVRILLEERQELFMGLLECLQHIRYNGAGMEDFLRITGLLLGDYLKIESITPIDGKPHAFQVWYCLDKDDESIPVMERLMRLSCWEYLIEKKYPQFRVSDGEIAQLDCIITNTFNEWQLTCTRQPTADLYYTLDGTNPKYSLTRMLYNGQPQYLSDVTHIKAYAQGGWFDVGGQLEKFASSNIAEAEYAPMPLTFDGTTTYNGDNTYRG